MRLLIVFAALLMTLVGQSSDIQRLKLSLEQNSENSQDVLLLAQMLEQSGQFDQAIEWYKVRLLRGGSKEEVWNIKFHIAASYEGLNQWHEAVYWYLDAYQTNPANLEPMLRLSTHFRIIGNNDLAYIFAKHGSRFSPFSDYQFDNELSIVAYYTRFKEDGYKASSDLVIRKDAPWYAKDQAYRNMLFYVENLRNTHFRPIKIELPLIVEGRDETYLPTNPSIIRTKDGYKVICRAVNYTQKGAKDFDTVDPSGYFKTRNFLVEYSKDFKVISQKEIVENLPRYRLPSCNVLGLEDARLFEFQEGLWFTCTNRDNTVAGVPQISLCKIGEDAEVEKMVLLKGPDPARCEKNWLPFVKNGAVHAIYSYDPFVIYKPDVETGDCEIDVNYHPTHDFSRFRGSAGPIEYEGGYLVLVHEVIYLSDHSRCYLHRFLQLDRRFFVRQISKPFTFLHQGVEFCNSMTLDHNGTHVVLAVGYEDSKAYICNVSLKTIKSMLSYP